MSNLNIALILGCARSGTSILGEMIGAHPDVRYKHEAHSIWNKAGEGENASHRLTKAHATEEITRKIRRKFSTEQGLAKLMVEKCPRSAVRVPFIRKVLPEAKLIHIIRDGRDVTCSMLPGVGGDEWRHLKPANWQELMRDYKGAIRCAHAWKTVLEIAQEDLKDAPHLTVRYEELVDDPRAVAKKIMRYLEVDESREVYNFCEKIQNKTRDSYQAGKQEKWFRDNHNVRVGRWKENLSAEDAEQVEAILEPMLKRLEYL